MPKAYIRVKQLNQTPASSFIGGTFKMTIKLTPGSIPLSASFTDQNPPMCNHVFRFDCQTFEKAIFEVCLNESAVFTKTDVARVTLPLNWFPINSVVEYWFPLKPLKPGTPEVFVLLVVHLADNYTSEFEAPPGKLLVKPCWSVPKVANSFMTPPSMPHAPPMQVVPPQQYMMSQQFYQNAPYPVNGFGQQTVHFNNPYPIYNQNGSNNNDNNAPTQWSNETFFRKY